MSDTSNTQELQDCRLAKRIAAISAYRPSLLTTTQCFGDVIAQYGVENVARLRNDDGMQTLMLWDMPCIFSHADTRVQLLRPIDLLEGTEAEDVFRRRKYTLAHVLFLILEVSSACAGLGKAYAHDSSIRVCGAKTCCNPYHRAMSPVHMEKTEFTNRLNMHQLAFAARFMASKGDGSVEVPMLVADIHAWHPIFMYIGTLKSSTEETYSPPRSRIYITAHRYLPTFDEDHVVEFECSDASGQVVAHVTVQDFAVTNAYTKFVDIPETVRLNGGTQSILRLVEDKERKNTCAS